MHECTKRLYAAGMLPVAVIGDARHAVPLCDALLAAGIDVIEVTFRTEAAAQAVAAIASERPGMLPGAGTILSVDQAEAAVRAGARFLVTPGFSPAVAAWCKNHEIPLYPGVSTATEVEQALAMGFTDLKFFRRSKAVALERFALWAGHINRPGLYRPEASACIT